MGRLPSMRVRLRPRRRARIVAGESKRARAHICIEESHKRERERERGSEAKDTARAKDTGVQYPWRADSQICQRKHVPDRRARNPDARLTAAATASADSISSRCAVAAKRQGRMIEVGESLSSALRASITLTGNLAQNPTYENALARPAGRPRARDEQRSHGLSMYCTVWIARGWRAAAETRGRRQQADRCDGRSCAVCLFGAICEPSICVASHEPARELLRKSPHNGQMHKMKMIVSIGLAAFAVPTHAQIGEVGASELDMSSNPPSSTLR